MGNVKGLNSVKKTLKKLERNLEKEVERGLLKAGLLLQRESQLLVPVDTGALKNSAKTFSEGTGFETVVYVAYAQSYGIFVHENLDNHHPVGEAKFLEKPARELQGRLADIIKVEIST